MPQHKLRFLLRPVASASRRSNARKTAFELRPTAQRVEVYPAYMGKASRYGAGQIFLCLWYTA